MSEQTTTTKTEDEAQPEHEFEKFIERGDDITTVTFRGVKFTFPTNRGDWPTRAMQAFQKRMNADGVELLLGPFQWNLFNNLFPKLSDFREFFPIFARAGGFMSDGD